jgi:HAD superfamily hydrolase (TIGR01509 family)
MRDVPEPAAGDEGVAVAACSGVAAHSGVAACSGVAARSGVAACSGVAARSDVAGGEDEPRGADARCPLAALVFDFDGLILDTETCTYETTASIFTEHGEMLDLAWWHSTLGTADHPHWADVLAERLGRPVDRAALVARREEQRLARLRALPARPGVVELLDAADAAGVPAAVASSSRLDWVGGHLERLGLAHRFAAVATRDDVGDDAARTKPAPDLFLAAAARLGADPARCVALEDSPNGIASARAAGMVVVAAPGPMTADLDLSAADLTVGSLLELDLRRLCRLLTRRP